MIYSPSMFQSYHLNFWIYERHISADFLMIHVIIMLCHCVIRYRASTFVIFRLNIAFSSTILDKLSHIYYIQEFIFSLSRVFHVATVSLRTARTHVRVSVDPNKLQRLVTLHSGVFVAMLRRKWLACGRD